MSRAGMLYLSEKQKQELKCLASALVCSTKWDELPWSDAWSGKYPDDPTDLELDKEYKTLLEKIGRLRGGGDLDYEYRNITEHKRMICLESCRTINIYHHPD